MPTLKPAFKPPLGKTLEDTALLLSRAEDDFKRLGPEEVVEVYHGTAGASATAGASERVGVTYVSLNRHIAKSYGLGEEPVTLHVKKKDLKPSPESVRSGLKTTEDSLFGAGEAVVDREVLRRQLPTGNQLFNAMSKAEQDKAIGEEPARLVREGEADLKDFVGHSSQAEQPDFITQRPTSDVAT